MKDIWIGVIFMMIPVLWLGQKLRERHRENKYPCIPCQDYQNHVIKYQKIPVYSQIPFQDFQYVYFLLHIINKLPDDDFIVIYACLLKWQKQKEITIEDQEGDLNICFHSLRTHHVIEDELYQILYDITEDRYLDYETMRIWFQTDYERINQWKSKYLQDMINQLRYTGQIKDDLYSLDIFNDLQKLLGYKKYLERQDNKKITKESMIYAMMFGLIENQYNFYNGVLTDTNPKNIVWR